MDRRLTLLLLIIPLIAGCGPGKVVPEYPDRCPPRDLTVVSGDVSMTLSWKPGCSKLISGYNIYISRDPMVAEYPGIMLPKEIEPHNHPVYPGDTNPEDGIEVYEAEFLDNGLLYYVSVRTVFPDGSLSEPSNEVRAVCGQSGEIELGVRYQSERDGYSFAENSYVEADALGNDLYFYTKDKVDYLCSPRRLDGFLKDNRLSLMPIQGDYEYLRSEYGVYGQPSGELKVSVRPGDWVWLQTEDQATVLIEILAVSGRDERRRIKLFYSYAPPGESLLL